MMVVTLRQSLINCKGICNYLIISESSYWDLCNVVIKLYIIIITWSFYHNYEIMSCFYCNLRNSGSAIVLDFKFYLLYFAKLKFYAWPLVLKPKCWQVCCSDYHFKFIIIQTLCHNLQSLYFIINHNIKHRHIIKDKKTNKKLQQMLNKCIIFNQESHHQ